MTRSNSDRLDKLEAEQAEMMKKLDLNSAQLAEIAESLVALSKIILQQSSVGAKQGDTEAPTADDQACRGVALLPLFEGEDPIGWLARAKQQFELNCTPPERKIAAAMVAMDGPALHWVIWLRSRKPGLTWDEFSHALVARFDTRFKGSPFERLAGLKQTGSVDDYVNLFVQLASQVPGLTDAHYLEHFMKGLKDSIRSSLRLLRPSDLETAKELSRDVEDNLAVQTGERSFWSFSSQVQRSNTFSQSVTTHLRSAVGGSQGGATGNSVENTDQTTAT